MRLAVKIANHVDANELGEVTAADTGFVLARNSIGRDTVRGLDIAFVSKSRAPEPLEFTWYEMGPDLAVEVISPTDRYTEVEEKVGDWLDAGTLAVIVVDPRRRTVKVYRTPADAVVLTEDDTLTVEDAVPGWKLPVSDIFE